MASLQARHSRSCALNKPWTPLEWNVDNVVHKVENECTCERGPLYHVVVREGKKAHKTAVGRNRRTAERALAKISTQVYEGDYQAQKAIRFGVFADRWIDSLERKETTKHSYRSTMVYAKAAFGEKVVRRLAPADVSHFNEIMKKASSSPRSRDEKKKRRLSASTRAKHLRVLHACLESAVSHGYAARNPVAALPAAEKPRSEKKESAYFTNDELPRLFAQIPESVADVPNVYRPLFLMALKTGMREGELIALTWGDIRMQESVVDVRHTYTGGHLTDPKNHEKREVHLTDEVIEMLGAWWGASGSPGDETLVFRSAVGDHLWVRTILERELYPAMVAAAIPRVGPTGEKRTFHSFRHTYAKIAIETGSPLTWLSKHLGHSSTSVTDTVYGHFESKELKREALKMQGAFGV